MAQPTARRLNVAPPFAARRYATRITRQLLWPGAWPKAAGAVAASEVPAGRLITPAAVL